MKILISGAAGFLGNRFARQYDVEGNIIDAVDNMQSPYAKMPKLRNGWTYGSDIREFIKYAANKTKHYDLMLHFAAPVGGREKIEGDPLFNAESLAIDSDVFRWAIDRVDKMVYPSSSAVYPTQIQDATVPQRLGVSDFRPEALHWGTPDAMYGFTKLAGEVLAYNAAKYGLDTLVLRPFSGYGEGQSHEYPFPSILQRVARRDDPIIVWGDGTQVRDFIHVDDIVRYVTSRVESGYSGYQPVNIGSGVGTSFNELIEMAVVAEGYTPDVQHLLEKPVGVHYRVAGSGIEQTVSLEEGVQRMLDYERKLL